MRYINYKQEEILISVAVYVCMYVCMYILRKFDSWTTYVYVCMYEFIRQNYSMYVCIPVRM